ncbi:uncharacterized protein PAC_03832 [Phialocephala subalpina]|uniref:Uncharacterized protein n=1 Tax=Phialocephala subalpina TaxID=576137 RepID=A0A1L7WME1_9HELO|nr:uncharacterized protein PAC_03832 [Phialocephala subalpina]
MRGIGKSRRKQRRYPQVSLEFLEDIGHTAIPIRSPVGQEKATPAHTSLKERDAFPATKRVRPPLPSPSSTGEPCPHPQYLQPQIEEHVPASEELPVIDRLWTGRIDPFVKFPVELNDRTRELIDLAFDDRYLNIGPFRDACLPVGMMDEAAFHQVLSNALLNISCRRSAGAKMETYDAMMHHTLAINSITGRIQDVEAATSDGFIGAVVSFMCYHVELKPWIRTGSSEPCSDDFLIIWTFWSSWVSLRVLPTSHFLIYVLTFDFVSRLLHMSLNLPPSLQNCTRDALTQKGDLLRFNNHLTHEVKRTNRRILSNGEFGTGYVFPLLHRILSLAGDAIIAPPDDLHILQGCRLACALYLAEIRRLFGINGVISTLQTQKLQHYLKSSIGNWDDLGLLRIWCLAMGGMESEGKLREWYAEEVQKDGVKMGWNTLGQLEAQMKGMLWFTEAHSPAFWELCKGLEYVSPSPTGSPVLGKWKPATYLQHFSRVHCKK